MVDDSVLVEVILSYIDTIRFYKSGRRKFFEDADMNIEKIIIKIQMLEKSVQIIIKVTSHHIPWIDKCFGRLKYKLKILDCTL